jgi:hypothetical protein
MAGCAAVHTDTGCWIFRSPRQRDCAYVMGVGGFCAGSFVDICWGLASVYYDGAAVLQLSQGAHASACHGTVAVVSMQLLAVHIDRAKAKQAVPIRCLLRVAVTVVPPLPPPPLWCSIVAVAVTDKLQALSTPSQSRVGSL